MNGSVDENGRALLSVRIAPNSQSQAVAPTNLGGNKDQVGACELTAVDFDKLIG